MRHLSFTKNTSAAAIHIPTTSKYLLTKLMTSCHHMHPWQFLSKYEVSTEVMFLFLFFFFFFSCELSTCIYMMLYNQFFLFDLCNSMFTILTYCVCICGFVNECMVVIFILFQYKPTSLFKDHWPGIWDQEIFIPSIGRAVFWMLPLFTDMVSCYLQIM